MRIKNKWISAGFQLIIAVCALIGILIQCGIFTGDPHFDVLNYFTVLSNLFCLIYFTAAAVARIRGQEKLFPQVKGAVIMSITVTGLIFHFMLSGSEFQMAGTLRLSNTLLHYVVPVMSVLDWILFDPKGTYNMNSPVKWLLVPDLYFMYTVIRAQLVGTTIFHGSRYPYFFIDTDALGWGHVLLSVLLLNVAFAVLGYVFYAVDWKLGKKTQKDA